MLSTTFAIAAAVSLVAGAPIPEKNGTVISVPLKKEVNHHHSNTSRLHSRDVETRAGINFTGVRYLLDIEIGGQAQTAVLDTGSSDTWTFSNKAYPGGYNRDASSSYEFISNDYKSTYGTGTTVRGTWARDTVSVGGVSVDNYDFAYIDDDSQFPDHQAVFGIGPQTAQQRVYLDYVERLELEGKIKSPSFSLFDSSEDGTEATLLFGGIDKAKYESPLYILPYDRTNLLLGAYYAVDFVIDGVKYTGGVSDSGTENVMLPKLVADAYALKYGAIWNPFVQGYFRYDQPPADLPDSEIKIGGITFTIPGNEMFTKFDDSSWLFAITRNIEQDGVQFNVSGDPILRQLYLFFDNEFGVVAFAPIKKTNASDIEAVGLTIPDSQPAPDQVVILDI